MSYIIRATPHTNEQIKALEEYLELSKIPYTVIAAAPSIVSPIKANPILKVERPKTVFKPTHEYRTFAGKEWLRTNNEVSFEDILERIYIHAKANNLLFQDHRGFYLDETLHTILKTTSTYIEWVDLYNHILLLFEKVK